VVSSADPCSSVGAAWVRVAVTCPVALSVAPIDDTLTVALSDPLALRQSARSTPPSTRKCCPRGGSRSFDASTIGSGVSSQPTSGFQSGALEFAAAKRIATVAIVDGEWLYQTRAAGGRPAKPPPWEHFDPYAGIRMSAFEA
jgi:hypothetical protein